ncbi:hybrid sensor histidine kinase/response regulator [Pseudothauera rhizosphaerae]|uniref:Chemotaxis protein CheA n=1 Tax=Pseudothauera rhizosphaerae TaxID=2565932 RepID=A0A4S4ANS2_9RHOO|nr:Hpt domain-containing protein [Pseudothauera rhizosphaerae]THF61279.1 response regulator [Pseudothauera rhizosphaerae]
MTQAIERDLGPLTWVKSEIDNALAHAAEGLEQAGSADDPATQVQFAQTHLHQARGALSIVGLDGLTQFADALDQLFGAAVRGDVAADAELLALGRRSLSAIGNYLEELVHGATDQPLRLASLYGEIQTARGRTGSAVDLFFPDLGRRPPRRAAAPRLGEEARRTRLRGLRTRFERGLLGWLRSPQDPAGAKTMRDAVTGIEQTLADSPARTLWWASIALFEALAAGEAAADTETRRLCAQLDAQLRRTLGGNSAVPDRLMREVLYLVARAPASTAHQRAVRDTWQLDTLMPEAGSAVSDAPLGPLLQTLHGKLAAAKETWDEFCTGSAEALARFETQLGELTRQAEQLGRPPFVRLLVGVNGFLQWLRKDPLQNTEALSMEVATALLLGESALERGGPDTTFSAQVADTLKRIAALMRGEAVESADQSPTTLGARRNQEREALTQLSREILSSLAHVEQALDDFFRNSEKRAPLAALATPLRQIEGALSLLGDEEAIAVVHEAAEEIAALAAAEDEPAAEQSASLAHRLSALGFYIQALQHGPASLARFLNPEQIEATELVEPPELPEAAPAIEELSLAPEPAPADAVEAQAEPAPAVEAPPEEVPVEEIVVEEVQEEDFSTEPPPAPAEVPAPAAETQRLIEASAEEIDAELLGIFIEEAHEVLDTISENLGLLRAEPSNTEYLTAVRRGFHTLKGSGRMVGLRELGEAAWGLEQTLNRWLQLEWTPTPALYGLVEAAREVFSAWVKQLEQGGAHGRDVTALLAEAELLRADDAQSREPASIGGATAPAGAEPAQPAEPVSYDFDLADAGDAEGAVEATATVAESTGTAEWKPESTVILAPIEASEFDLQHEPETVARTAPHVRAENPFLPSTAEAADEDVVAEALEEFEFDLEPALEIEQQLAPERPAAPEAAPAAADATIIQREAPSVAPQPTAEATAPAEDESDFVRIGEAEISRPLYDLYLAEARHHIATLHHELARLQANPVLLPPEVSVRAAHTLAGISGTARMAPLQALARALEHALSRSRDNQIAPTAEQAALLQSSLETLEAMVAEVGGFRMPLPVPELAEQLETVGRHPVEEVSAEPLYEAADEIVLEPAPEPAVEAALEAALEAEFAADAELATEPEEPDEAVQPVEAAAEEMTVAEVVAVATAAAEAAAAEPAAPEAAPVHDEIDTQLLPIFLEEGAELLSELHAALRAWREAPADADHPQRIARQLHTLKGSARMTGAMNLGEHVHQMESAFEAQRKKGEDVAALIEYLEGGLDVVEQALDVLASGGEPAGAAASAAAAATQTAGAAETGAVEIAAEGEASSASATLRVRADAVDSFVNQAGEIGIARTRIEGELRTLRRSLLDLTENVIRLRNQLREVEIQAEVQMQSRIAQAESHEDDFDPLEMDRYTRLQELTRMMAESVNDVTTVQQNLLKNLDGADVALHGQARISRELQQALMQVRMVPFDSLADRLYRVVRQAAKDLGKRANLDLRGGRIELDRGVLEHMVAPLEHLLRNSLAHGIEDAEARRAAGKAEIGEITLTVRQEGNEIAIELADDGAGLNFARIAERARANGLLGADEQTDEKRLTNLIFVPGFSTAGSVSTIAGRGVGMDVVKAETAAVGGRIEVSSERGEGTRFRIYLPLTLAVTQALLVRAGNRSWAIPSSMIAQVLELKADPLERLRTEHGTEWQGEHYSYRYLPRLLGDHHTQPEVQRFNWVLLLRAGAQTLALHVDALRGNQEIVVKNAGPQVARLVGVSGATVLGDGEIVLILNPVALASRGLGGEEGADAGAGLQAEAAPAVVRIPTIMVVDDSLTVRKITGRLLEREGYRVVTAKDGVDALEKLIETVPDVVLSDIEMPRMDGFDLVRNIRADERTRAVPVIMITSRLADKHKRYAEEVGANHYLGKPFQEEELLGLLADYTAAVH